MISAFRLSCDVVFDLLVDGIDARRVQVLVAATLNEAGASAGECIEMSVVFCDEERIADANRAYRSVDAPTDVLAFPIDGLSSRVGEGEPRVLGDLLICPSYVSRQIKDELTMQGESDLTLAVERCIVHGTLHLAGFDHERSEHDAKHMFELEQLVLDRVRIAGSHSQLGDESDEIS